MKMLKSVLFAEKSLRRNMLKIKNFAKLEIIFIIQVNVEFFYTAYEI